MVYGTAQRCGRTTHTVSFRETDDTNRTFLQPITNAHTLSDSAISYSASSTMAKKSNFVGSSLFRSLFPKVHRRRHILVDSTHSSLIRKHYRIRSSPPSTLIMFIASFTTSVALTMGLFVTTTEASMPSFVPLACNAKMDQVKCDTWSDRFGTRSTFTDPVIVPCGECILLDRTISGSTLTFEDGIDIRGKLVFLEGTTIHIRTPMIAVQGELHMYAAKNAVNGIPSIHILMTGQNDKQAYTAIDENSKKCSDEGTSHCEVGKKSITVAGGKVNIQGLPPNTPTWINLYDVAYLSGDTKERPSAIVLEESIKGKWDVGAEILITSHTRSWDGHQVRKIKKVSDYDLGEGYVLVELDAPIIRPTTIRQSKDYAVEVALLSRNIVFQGGPDDVENHGAHFSIRDTPKVKQTLIGVDFQNFGQQGYLGRYPIHIHMNGAMPDSIVAKNTVRQSNQRCIVVHGVRDLLVEGNVAYDTKGHCFIVEDGIETGNKFIKNLGAQTGIPKRLIPDTGPNGDETDDRPSTFWITNPTNSWIGNVAAGSEGSGFWFEPLLRGTELEHYPDINPKTADLIAFENNVAHSNEGKGFQTYPTGYIPDGVQEMNGLKSYRNGGQGIFVHLSKNIKFNNVLVADNRYIGIDIDRAEGITVKNSRIIGLSRSYTDFMNTQDAGDSCGNDRSYGIDLHSWKNNPDYDKVTIEDVTFIGYKNCPKAYPLHVDDDIRTGKFNAYCSFRGITTEDQTSAITLCDAERSDITDIYFTDLDGSLFLPTDRNVNAPAAVVSNSAAMMTFVDGKKCTANPRECYNYCEGTCFRSYRIEVDPANTENYSLQVCSRTNTKLCTRVKGYQKESELEEFVVGDNRVFLVHVPVGAYDAVFLDPSGNRMWPSFVLFEQEELTCNTPFPADAVRVIVPAPELSECKQLVRNGNLEASDIGAKFWLFRNGGIELVKNKGTNKSKAMAPIDRSAKASLIQYLDTRCLAANRGRIYELTAMIRLESAGGEPYFCDAVKKECPDIGYRSSNDGVYRSLAEIDSLDDMDKDGYHTLTKYFEINDDMAASNQTLIYIQSNVASKRMIVDDVKIKLVEQDDTICKSIIQMPQDLPTRYWRVVESGKLDVIEGPNNQPAMLFKSRRDENDPIAYNNWPSLILEKCFKADTKLKITAEVQLVQKGTTKGATCDLSTEDCPALRFLAYEDRSGKEFINEKQRSYTSKSWNANGFNTAQATIVIPKDRTVNKVVFQISSFTTDYDLIVGTVTISPMF